MTNERYINPFISQSFHKEKINTFAFRNAVRLYVENINFY